MLKTTLFFTLFTIRIISGYSQREAYHWYFGNGVSLDFSHGSPKAINDGELYTNEGCASVSDNKGHLLFYTDGLMVWDKEHMMMPNGIGLGGSNSSTQSCIILQKPGSETIYYLFTVDEFAGPKGFSYSIIDMGRNNGLGVVVVKNQSLLGSVSEKVTAVKHASGKGWWVIVHQWNSNAFYSYLFDEKGVSLPVISNAGVVHKDMGSGKNSESIGYLKGSPDGKKLASAMCYVPNNNIEVFDFNNMTGVVSNPVKLPSPGNAYGVCFSPDNSKLYVSYESGSRGLYQYNMLSSDIAKSAIMVSPNDSTRYGAMQMGPDGRMYVAKLGQFLDVISNPNAPGKQCGYIVNGVNLKGMYSTFGLPDFFVLNYVRLKVDLGNDTVVCEKSCTLDAKNPGAKYVWSTGEVKQKITIGRSGTYWVQVSVNGQSATDTIRVKFRKPLKLELGKDTIICGDIYPMDAGNSGLGYRWSTGASTQVYVATKSGTYVVTVTDGICVKTDSVKVTFPNGGPAFIPMKEFKPNNGGFNDRFDYILNGITWFDLKVTNRHGKVMFETSDKKKKWDGTANGKEVSKGEYTWEIKYKSVCTRTKVMTEKGVVMVL